MNQFEIDIEYRVIIGISAMVLLFASFLIAFITSQRKKLQYHKNLQDLNERQQRILADQNMLLEKRVQERTAELSHQKEELQALLFHLKATQSQLVQREKMASLGELTAGIAHEIQNPLNFVNNFSEISVELVEELISGPLQGLPDENKKEAVSLVEEISMIIAKINQHGKRADNIVKGMLEHSRSSTGIKEPGNINALAEEYLRLSYHGLRAKDKSFQVTLESYFDESIINISFVKQDIGRVLLNLFNNAFYSVREKKKIQDTIYEPKVTLTTKRLDDKIQILIRDNGLGIPSRILSKIYQPFFTTKPAGQGTGLGLSLSYDMIKAHGGELKVETSEGDFAEFIIELPIT